MVRISTMWRKGGFLFERGGKATGPIDQVAFVVVDDIRMRDNCNSRTARQEEIRSERGGGRNNAERIDS